MSQLRVKVIKYVNTYNFLYPHMYFNCDSLRDAFFCLKNNNLKT
jgi:hypothetical protein